MIRKKDDPRYRIRTFGSLQLEISGRIIQGREWRGRVTRQLLKLLVAHGGRDVPIRRITASLWPEADDKTALNRFRVTLTRLRRIGCGKNDPTPPWITVRHARAFIDASLCAVDALLFPEWIDRAIITNDLPLLETALALCSDDFLPGDAGAPVIIRYRRFLRREFIKGVAAFAQQCPEPEKSVPLLIRAIEKDPDREPLYAALMRAHLDLGFPAEALAVFHQARKTLGKRLGIAPGQALCALKAEIQNQSAGFNAAASSPFKEGSLQNPKT